MEEDNILNVYVIINNKKWLVEYDYITDGICWNNEYNKLNDKIILTYKQKQNIENEIKKYISIKPINKVCLN